jgi:alanine racemase
MLVRKKIDNLFSHFEKTFITQNNITVSRAAILHNLNLFADSTQQTIIPVLKGNAYGHGIAQITRILEGQKLSYVAVDGYFEALRIREVSKLPILILGAIDIRNYANLNYANFAFSVQDKATIEALASTGKQINVHLECNTGMNRYGAQLNEIDTLTRLILSHKNLHLEGVMTHLADSTAETNNTIDTASKLYDQCIEIVLSCGAQPRWYHIAQSAGAIRVISKYSNAIRLGIGLYGINPFEATHALHDQFAKTLQPALSLTSTLTKINRLAAGDQVSYGYTFTAKKAMTIGVIPFGYYEGIDRNAYSNAGIVHISDHDTPVIGRVCMNHTMISLDGIDAKIGDPVTIYSNKLASKLSIDKLAQRYHLFTYEMLARLSSDIRRQLVD